MNKKGSANYTAIGIAAIRATESMKPEGDRLFNDPFAKIFASETFTGRFLMWLGRLLSRYVEKSGNGEWGAVLSRVRYIDDYLQHCIEEGIQQLVILGAGFDSRAYRFKSLEKGITVFEVDLPELQEYKKNCLEKFLGSLPEYVKYVPVDFDKESLEDRLIDNGYDTTLKTLFIWEGVTEYISQEAADLILDFVVKNSGKGSSIIFDYPFLPFKHAFIAKNYAFKEFGHGMITNYLEAQGFENIVNAINEDFKAKYFPEKNIQISPIFAIVYASVK